MQVVAGGGEAMRDVDETVRRLRRQGYTVTRSKGTSHWKATKGGRLLASISSTSGDRKSLRNIPGQIRRAEARS
jgi:hypothetical protein